MNPCSTRLPDQQVEVTENSKVYPFFMDNEVVRGGVLIESGIWNPCC